MKNPIALATMQPGIMYRGSYNTASSGCNIDESSKLTLGTVHTHPKYHVDLFQRPYVTVPYLGRGSVHPTTESQILQGEQVTNRRSVNQLSERNHSKYMYTPFIPEMDKHLQGTRVFESDADSNWVRGGIPVRELERDRMQQS